MENVEVRKRNYDNESEERKYGSEKVGSLTLPVWAGCPAHTGKVWKACPYLHSKNFLIRYSSLPKSSVTDVFLELNQNRSSIGAVSDLYE